MPILQSHLLFGERAIDRTAGVFPVWACTADGIRRIHNFDPGVGIFKQDLMDPCEILNEFGAIPLPAKAL
jgi:hypothetical protein